MYIRLAWTFVSPIPVWFEIVQIPKNGIKLNASIINYVHQTGINLYDATNIVKIPRPTNVFRGCHGTNLYKTWYPTRISGNNFDEASQTFDITFVNVTSLLASSLKPLPIHPLPIYSNPFYFNPIWHSYITTYPLLLPLACYIIYGYHPTNVNTLPPFFFMITWKWNIDS